MIKYSFKTPLFKRQTFFKSRTVGRTQEMLEREHSSDIILR